jgi:uncharacterized membrane protein YeiH
VLGELLSWGATFSVYLSAAVIVLVRILAVVYGWRLPAFKN